MKLTKLFIKVVHLIQYSNEKTNFREIKIILDLENWHQELKNAVFWQLSIKRLYMVSKILWGCSFGCKDLLNFTCLVMKFHNCHHASMQYPAIHTSIHYLCIESMLFHVFVAWPLPQCIVCSGWTTFIVHFLYSEPVCRFSSANAAARFAWFIGLVEPSPLELKPTQIGLAACIHRHCIADLVQLLTFFQVDIRIF